MSGAISVFSIMTLSGRQAGLTLNSFEIMTYRSLLGFWIVFAVATCKGTLGRITMNRIGLHPARNACHFVGQNLWFCAITLVPLAQIVALEFTYPIWVALAAPIVLPERLTQTRVAAARIGFAGILNVVRPGFVAVSPPMIAALLAAVGFAGSAMLIRNLTRNQSITCILFWLTLLQAIMGIICAGIAGDIAIPSRAALPFVLLIGLSGLTAHFCLTKALSLAPATVVTPMDFARLPVIAVAAAAVYGEALVPFVLARAPSYSSAST